MNNTKALEEVIEQSHLSSPFGNYTDKRALEVADQAAAELEQLIISRDYADERNEEIAQLRADLDEAKIGRAHV